MCVFHVSEAISEVKKLRVSQKDSEATGAEADALREMVADLTEGKIVFTTKASKSNCVGVLNYRTLLFLYDHSFLGCLTQLN